MGIARMKALAQSYVWWPKLDQDVEHLAKSCSKCQAERTAPPLAPLHPWVWPTKPWQRVHVDYAGAVQGPSIPHCGGRALQVAGGYRDEDNDFTCHHPRTASTFRFLWSSGAVGIRQWTTGELEKFLKCNGIKHICSAPYHPSSNGSAERFVQTFKRAMRASEHPELSFHQQLMGFLLSFSHHPTCYNSGGPCFTIPTETRQNQI